MNGYSDVVNHALAFAAKHHDRQVRKGTRLPYLTHPASVAVILTRYRRDENTVVAGILHDVVEDCVRGGFTQRVLEQRIGEKFGAEVLKTVLSVTYRRQDEDGVEFSDEDRKNDYLARLGGADEPALWVCAADKLHNAASIISDLKRTVDAGSIWSRFGGGREVTVRGYRDVYERLREIGFKGEIMLELDRITRELESFD